MKIPLLTFLFSALVAPWVYAQDIITKKSGEDIQVMVLEVNQTDVRFKSTIIRRGLFLPWLRLISF